MYGYGELERVPLIIIYHKLFHYYLSKDDISSKMQTLDKLNKYCEFAIKHYKDFVYSLVKSYTDHNIYLYLNPFWKLSITKDQLIHVYELIEDKCCILNCIELFISYQNQNHTFDFNDNPNDQHCDLISNYLSDDIKESTNPNYIISHIINDSLKSVQFAINQDRYRNREMWTIALINNIDNIIQPHKIEGCDDNEMKLLNQATRSYKRDIIANIIINLGITLEDENIIEALKKVIADNKISRKELTSYIKLPTPIPKFCYDAINIATELAPSIAEERIRQQRIRQDDNGTTGTCCTLF